jgi:hypothetical protein
MPRCAPTLAFAPLAIACAPSITPDFEGRYDAIEAIARCYEHSELTSGTASYVAFTPEIERDEHRVYTVELPSIECPIDATLEGDELRFAPQDCASSDRDERDIHGTAKWNDDHELAIVLDSTEYWLPQPGVIPDGLVWECGHDYRLVPLDD